jgi:hypothetical protein
MISLIFFNVQSAVCAATKWMTEKRLILSSCLVMEAFETTMIFKLLSETLEQTKTLSGF